VRVRANSRVPAAIQAVVDLIVGAYLGSLVAVRLEHYECFAPVWQLCSLAENTIVSSFVRVAKLFLLCTLAFVADVLCLFKQWGLRGLQRLLARSSRVVAC
jgi:hypothetical protein